MDIFSADPKYNEKGFKPKRTSPKMNEEVLLFIKLFDCWQKTLFISEKALAKCGLKVNECSIFNQT
jgi:hypothetical protein